MGEFKSLLRKTSDDYHGPRARPLVGKFGEVSYAPPQEELWLGPGTKVPGLVVRPPGLDTIRTPGPNRTEA